jgi:hypothetical protein
MGYVNFISQKSLFLLHLFCRLITWLAVLPTAQTGDSKHMYVRNTFVIAIVLAVVGCTAIQVQPIDRSVNLKHVCIQENPKVIVAEFVTVLRDGFDRHGISTEVFSGSAPDRCEYILTYTALQSWDFSTYLSHAELRLEHKGRKVAYAEYHLRGIGTNGGLSLMKWQGTKTKMDPVMDELLKAY